MYLDANNLYGHSMIQLLPIEMLDWDNLKIFNWGNYSDNGSKRCFLEVGLDFPGELHDLHNDYPSAPEKTKVTKELLSEYHKRNLKIK